MLNAFEAMVLLGLPRGIAVQIPIERWLRVMSKKCEAFSQSQSEMAELKSLAVVFRSFPLLLFHLSIVHLSTRL